MNQGGHQSSVINGRLNKHKKLVILVTVGGGDNISKNKNLLVQRCLN